MISTVGKTEEVADPSSIDKAKEIIESINTTPSDNLTAGINATQTW
jgi:hypothetical protein